ncbi:MAG: SMI1/KNR4 family protein [Oscillatoriaceae cyanobacterium Prado104]|nr:SMI1/KNR4 family protein [Oscillatoriaceae cyanobacterium Prado104]
MNAEVGEAFGAGYADFFNFVMTFANVRSLVVMSYASEYAKFVRRHLGKQPELADGLSETQIGEAEKKLGFQLPVSVRDYYKIAGNLPELNRAHNQLLDIPGFLADNDFWIFMEENQEVVSWGIKTKDLASSDPEVWQRVNSNPPEWYSEEMTFSEFIVQALDLR